VGVHASSSMVRTPELAGHVGRPKPATGPRSAIETPCSQASGGADTKRSHAPALCTSRLVRSLGGVSAQWWHGEPMSGRKGGGPRHTRDVGLDPHTSAIPKARLLRKP